MQEQYPSPFHNQTDNLANIVVTSVMIAHLQATKPWVRLMSIILFISVGLMILVGVVMMFMPATPGMGGIGPLIGILYILLSGLYIVPGIFLHRYASSIGDLLEGGGDVAMEAALGSQKSFWRFVGIVTLIVIALYVLAIIFMILFGMMSAMR